jgi:tRNA G10  N-methylase Trm11
LKTNLFNKPGSKKVLVDPFCGCSSVLLAASHAGIDVIGVDVDPKQCAAARKLLKIKK